MGRGRVQLKRIENKINRQVTFSKRRNGLLKKGHEICVLCDSEVALIVFSPKGKLYEYSTDNAMEKILERYHRYSYSVKPASESEDQSQENCNSDCAILKSKIEALQKSERNLMGEQLDKLTLKDLQQLEQQLETSLKHIRSKKNQSFYSEISELQNKEKNLREQNASLRKILRTNKGKSPETATALNIGQPGVLREEEIEANTNQLLTWMSNPPVIN